MDYLKMKIKTLKLLNWMPYKGEQEIIFPQNTHANILIINGENMHGKTSLINAFRWCMYDEAQRGNQVIPIDELINIEAKNEGSNNLKVELTIEADNKEFHLVREIDYNKTNPSSEVSLKIDGRAQTNAEIKKNIEYLVPEQISQFLLFDGELLQEFQELVISETSQQSKSIKSNIEKTLGIPIIQRAVEEIEDKNKKVTKLHNDELAKNKQIERMAKDLLRHESDKSSKEQEYKTLQNNIDITNQKIKLIDDKLKHMRNDIALDQERQILEKKELELEKTIVSGKETQKEMNTQLWRFPLSEAILPKVEDMEKQIEVLNKEKEKSVLTYAQIRKIEDSLQNGLCSECGNQLTDQKKSEMKEELESYRKVISTSQDNQNLINELIKKTSNLKISLDQNLKTNLIKITTEIGTSEREKIKIKNDLFEIKKKLENVDVKNSSTLNTQRVILNKELGRLEGQLVDSQSEIEEIERHIQDIKNNPNYKEQEQGSKYSKQAKYFNDLKSIFKTASEKYRDSMRLKVQQKATEAFEKLTTEKTFDKLEINESYGLKLIREGKEVAKSSGAEQIVALSLMDALNQLGRRKGPMIMDTPMGRLDLNHRKNILKYLPEATTQLAVFVHSGEINLNDLENYLDKSKVGEMYNIIRKSDSYSLLERSN